MWCAAWSRRRVSGLGALGAAGAGSGQGGGAEKESRRWFRGFEQGQELGRESPQTRVVVVGDRESDIFELFERQAERSEEAGLLVRVNLGRQRKVQAECPVLGDTRVRAVEAHLDFVEPVVKGRPVVDFQILWGAFFKLFGGREARTFQIA